MRRLREIELRTPLGEGPGGTRLCDQPGCTEEGLYRAPKSRDRLTDYYVFCLDHVRDYNSTWDYYRGMSQDQIEAHIRYDTVWQRPTWPLGNFGSHRGGDPLDAIRDGYGFFAERQEERKAAEDRWRPHTAEERALSVLGLKPRRFCRAFTARYEAVPAAQLPGAGDEPFSGAKRAPVVGIGDMDQGKPCRELRRALRDVGGKAGGDRLGSLGAGPVAAILIGRGGAQRRLGVAAQHGGEGAFIARRRADLVERGG